MQAVLVDVGVLMRRRSVGIFSYTFVIERREKCVLQWS